MSACACLCGCQHAASSGVPSLLQRDKEVVAKLFADIEGNTLRNIKERSLREQQRHETLEEEEEENSEREQAGLDTPPTFPSTVYQGEEDVDGSKVLQEDPFEVVAPVASEHGKPDERSLDAVLEFEHSLEEDQMEGEGTCSLAQEPSAGLSHMEVSAKDVSSAQRTGSESDDGCTTAAGWELAERHTAAEPPPASMADPLLNHSTGDVPQSGTHNSANPWLQGAVSILFYLHMLILFQSLVRSHFQV